MASARPTAWRSPMAIVVMRAVAALLGPLLSAWQLLCLWWHLRSDESSARARTRAADVETRFTELLHGLPGALEPWQRKLLRKKWEGRGIVIVAGGELYGRLACECVASLREHGCTLPVEVWHLGAAELEAEAMRALAAQDGVSVRDLLGVHPALCDEPGYGYAAKPLALAASAFEEVLLLDADNSAVDDPSRLFESDTYVATGSLFWCDMYAERGAKFVRMWDPWGVRRRPSRLECWIQDVIDERLIRPVRARPDFTPALEALGLRAVDLTHESGQLLCHKTRCVRGLAAVVLLNLNVNRRLAYAGLHGDKDTFRVAWAASGTPFSCAGEPPELGGSVDSSTGVFYDSCFVQRHLGRPIFHHYCGRHRDDDHTRVGRPPSAVMSSGGRPFRRWPTDDRRGYMDGVVRRARS